VKGERKKGVGGEGGGKGKGSERHGRGTGGEGGTWIRAALAKAGPGFYTSFIALWKLRSINDIKTENMKM